MAILQFVIILMSAAGAYGIGAQVQEGDMSLSWGFFSVWFFALLVQAMSDVRAQKRAEKLLARMEALEAQLGQLTGRHEDAAE